MESHQDTTRVVWTRTDYMAHPPRVSHQEYYAYLADVIGREAVERIVLMTASLPQLREALAAGDAHLNTIPLAKWDGADPAVRALVAHNARAVMAVSWNGQPLRAGSYCWSRSESVCVLKAAARRLAESERIA